MHVGCDLRLLHLVHSVLQADADAEATNEEAGEEVPHRVESVVIVVASLFLHANFAGEAVVVWVEHLVILNVEPLSCLEESTQEPVIRRSSLSAPAFAIAASPAAFSASSFLWFELETALRFALVIVLALYTIGFHGESISSSSFHHLRFSLRLEKEMVLILIVLHFLFPQILILRHLQALLIRDVEEPFEPFVVGDPVVGLVGLAVFWPRRKEISIYFFLSSDKVLAFSIW